MTSRDARDLSADDFEPLIGSDIEVSADDESLPPLRLDAIARLRSQPGAPRQEPFSLAFSAQPPVREQGIYRLEHADLGSVDMFLVPIGREPNGRVRYEAVFN